MRLSFFSASDNFSGCSSDSAAVGLLISVQRWRRALAGLRGFADESGRGCNCAIVSPLLMPRASIPVKPRSRFHGFSHS